MYSPCLLRTYEKYLRMKTQKLWEISKNGKLWLGRSPKLQTTIFNRGYLHNALTTGHYNNLWTRGKEWKKNKRFIALCIIFHMVFGSGVHPQLSCKEALPSPTQWVKQQHLHMLKTPICLFGVPWKRYKYHVVWLTQGVWQPNLAYPRLN
jgi:hypothetical protein